jgi:prefoldin subunit 5
MDSSPLVKAHDHARAAAVATRQASDTTVAIAEHTHAAGEFANAAQSTSSLEALRTLKLLEEHHRKLAELLSLPTEQPLATQQQSAGHGGDRVSEKLPVVGEESASSDDAPSTKEASSTDAAAAAKSAQKSGPPQQRRIASREMSSSIASNLASARGIRSKYRGQPLSPSISNDQAPGNVDAHPRRDASKAKMQTLIEHNNGKPSWAPPMPTSLSSKPEVKRERTAHPPTPEADSAIAEDVGGYARFYNTFGSLINRISAPLAFAGLPLIQEESALSDDLQTSETSPAKRTQVRSPQPASQDVDLSNIYSKAALRAFEGHSASDSFYVVPTSGHTMSYANILSYAKKEQRRMGASNHGSLDQGLEEEDDDFVDARETPAVPQSPDAKRRARRARTERDLQNSNEELYLENKSLKDMLDKLTKRLHTFEASAQNMAESYRLMRPGSPLASSGGREPVRGKDTEEEYQAMRQHIERLEKDNKKMQNTLEKYREKWETLKAGAKARREAQVGADSIEDSGPG